MKAQPASKAIGVIEAEREGKIRRAPTLSARNADQCLLVEFGHPDTGLSVSLRLSAISLNVVRKRDHIVAGLER